MSAADLPAPPSAARPAEPAPADPAAAVAALLPELRRIGRRGLLACLGCTGAGAAAAAAAAAAGDWGLAGITATLTALATALAYELTRRREEAVVMPALAGALGLAYRQDAADFLESLPERLLPAAARRRVDDVLEGPIAGRHIRFGEVTIATGGKNSRTLFRGIVAEMPAVAALPPFFAAVETDTRGWLGFSGRIRVDDLVRHTTLETLSGETLGVWTPAPEDAEAPALAGLLAALAGLEAQVGESARLYSASCDGRRLHVALRFARDLFRIANPFAGDERLVAAISRAFADLEVPVRVVAALLAAEAAADRAGARG